MISYWEQQSFTQYTYIVIGAGIVGISTAIELRERHPAARILVLERGLLPTGATTRNAGFACAGSATELLEDLETHTEAAVVQLFLRRRRGLQRLRSRLGDAAIRYDAAGGYELIRKEELYALDKIGYLNALLRPHLGEDVFEVASHLLPRFGFAPQHVKALIRNRGEAGIHSGELVRSILVLAQQSGIEIMTGARVLSFSEEAGCVKIFAENAARQTPLVLAAQQLCICTNAFAKELLPDEDVVPGRGQILITEPIDNLPFRGVFHLERGYYYFREIDGRVLLGGGRNLDFEGERSTAFALSDHIQQDLERKLHDLILPGRKDIKIAQRWAGIMAFGATKGPVVKAFSPRIAGAFRMGGMGVALGSEVAAEVAGIMCHGS